MFQRMSRTWTLFRASWEVLKSDKELALFPVLSSLACLLLLASFIVPAVISGAFDSAGPGTTGDDPPGLVLLLSFAFYFGSFFIVTFFNTALVACAVKRLEGGDPTIGYGISEASSRLGIILQWTLMASLVGMLLRALEERAGFLGRIVISLIGALWSLATFFVVPILVVERLGPVDALKRSVFLLKRTWGEQIASGIGFGMIGMLLGIPGILLVFGGFMMAGAGMPLFLAVSVGLLGVAWFIALAVVSATLQTIFQAALYLYATDGKARGPFTEEALRASVVRK